MYCTLARILLTAAVDPGAKAVVVKKDRRWAHLFRIAEDEIKRVETAENEDNPDLECDLEEDQNRAIEVRKKRRQPT